MFDIEIEGADKAGAEAALKAAADKLLANTVIENYRIEVYRMTAAAIKALAVIDRCARRCALAAMCAVGIARRPAPHAARNGPK